MKAAVSVPAEQVARALLEVPEIRRDLVQGVMREIRLFTGKEVCRLLGIHPSTFRALPTRPEPTAVPGLASPRYRAAAVVRWLDGMDAGRRQRRLSADFAENLSREGAGE